ncbi:MAG: sulfite exporter TauE/SafE family protein [Bacteroidetes bacterium]|nr:sulfite exporter TauE/SafE family protein [Bacteroidota bacterium]
MLWSAFIFGLLGSLHCIGMCGPIAFMLPLDRSSHLKKVIQLSSYHLGRLVAYSLIGMGIGVIGKSFHLFGLQQYISIFIGCIMIVMVIIPSKYSNKYSFSNPTFKLIAKVKTTLGQTLKKKTSDTFLTIGFLNGFLPCGLVYMAVFASLSMTEIFLSSLYMVLFGLGTIPLMTTVIYVGNVINTSVKQRIKNIIPFFVFIIGILFILRGMGLGIPYLSPAPITEMVSSSLECH